MSESVDLVGSTVNGRYHVAKKLFSGFYGTCWKAHDAFLDDDVCIKTFFVENKDQLKELAILKEFVKGHFDHENLCQVLDVSLHKAPVLSGKEALVPHITALCDSLGCRAAALRHGVSTRLTTRLAARGARVSYWASLILAPCAVVECDKNTSMLGWGWVSYFNFGCG